ncbi:hypothetical protein PHYPSEUDO_010093 [Phytophthora pseudosyringae]|uniref:RNase H type-1 domain-containing protein n=1 Tax=Phytophthora pseudosyringae TaxID=221518 RepID=A0A8T1VDW3_9STRA|nr:hypothetical protein PHYPSEUDO_010093 [Phytophthora pseudosyringae]
MPGGEGQRLRAEALATTLVFNFMQIVRWPHYPSGVYFTTIPEDHPVIASMRKGDLPELILTPSITGPPTRRQVTSHGQLDRELTRSMAPDVEVKSIHPHPDLGRLVCLRAGRRRWTRRRRDYKDRVKAASKCRGEAMRNSRAGKWEQENKDAAGGMVLLDWKRIRRIVECAKKGYAPLHVIGDSSKVVGQHRRRKPPESRHLNVIHWRCRRLVNCTMVNGWHHQPRSSNMMVHTLANNAIDSNKSKQVHLHDTLVDKLDWNLVQQHMDLDMAPWITTMEHTTLEDVVADCTSLPPARSGEA